MPKSTALCITLCRRPDYTQRLFDALGECLLHAPERDYFLFVSCDWHEKYPVESEQTYQTACTALEVIQDTFGVGSTLYRNRPRRGIDLNKLFIIPEGFAWADFMIFLEDDTIPGKDALIYFEHMRDRLQGDPRIWSICGYRRIVDPDQQAIAALSPFTVDIRQGFCPWGWATWKDRWEARFGDGGERYKAETGIQANGLFDHWLNGDHGHYMAVPRLARTQSIGGDRAEHTPSPEWHRDNEYNEFGVWSEDIGVALHSDDWTICNEASQ